MKRLAIIPTVFALVASLALLGCGDIAGPSVEAPQFTHVGDPTIDRNGDTISCEKVLNENTGRLLVVDNHIPDGPDANIRKDCPLGFTLRGF